MPLLRIESRPKQPANVPPGPGRPTRTGRESKSGAGMAALGGLLLGLVVVAGIAAFLLGRTGAQQGVTDPAPGQGTLAASGGVAGSPAPGGTVPAVAANLEPINSDYPRETVVASVMGEPYTMGELEVAVRIAHVLGALTGDAVPAYGSPELQGFQVRMLKRQIDVILMKKEAAAKGISLPGEPIANFIDDFVSRVGGSQARLQQLMGENGVTQAQLDKWFEDSALINTFVAQELMAERDPSEREALTTAWLSEQWQTHQEEILVNFYDPDTVGTGAGRAGSGCDGGRTGRRRDGRALARSFGLPAASAGTSRHVAPARRPRLMAPAARRVGQTRYGKRPPGRCCELLHRADHG